MKYLLFFSFALLSGTAATAAFKEPVAPPSSQPDKKMKPEAAAQSAAAFLETGDVEAARHLADSFANLRPDLSNIINSQIELYGGNTAGALQALENIERPDSWTLS